MSIIVKRRPSETYNVAGELRLRAVNGKVGLEIEVEGNKFPIPTGMQGSPTPVICDWSKGYWSYVHDGSLRGKANAEYVFQEAKEFADVDPAIDELFAKFKTFGSRLDDSNRTSVHVHLNVQDFFLNRLTSLMALWILFETPLIAWCGEYRVGNLFCLSAKDAEAIVSHLRRFISSDMNYQLRDGLHYAGMNAYSIMKKGSLEFRTLGGTKDPEVIKNWVKILKRLYDLSGEYPDPRYLCEGFSGEGPLAFFDRMFGDLAGTIKATIPMNDEQLREALYDSVRLCQDLCYCRDWETYKGIEMKPNPFGRTRKRRSSEPQEEEMASSAPTPYGNIIPNFYNSNPFIQTTQQSEQQIIQELEQWVQGEGDGN